MNHEYFMRLAIEEALKAEPSQEAYSVGAVLVHDSQILSTGYSRETPGNTHAEEVCLLKLKENPPSSSILYSTMEPCGRRLSGKKCCVERILSSGIKTVVIGCMEPTTFVQDCQGLKMLQEAQIQVIYLSEFQGFPFLRY